jgi:hypothetical protein
VFRNLNCLGLIYEHLDPDDKTSLASCNSPFLKRAIRTGQMGAIKREGFFVDPAFKEVRFAPINVFPSRVNTVMWIDLFPSNLLIMR